MLSLINLRVSKDVAATEGIGVVHQCWIDHDPVLRSIKEIGEVTEVSVAPSNAIACAVLIQDDHLRG